jgi:hypothetical protein
MDIQESPEYIPVWQCIGCGRIEAPQTCIGVCRDNKVLFIDKDTHERALAEIARVREELTSVRERLLKFSQCSPKNGLFEQTFVALQAELRDVVRRLPSKGITKPAK